MSYPLRKVWLCEYICEYMKFESLSLSLFSSTRRKGNNLVAYNFIAYHTILHVQICKRNLIWESSYPAVYYIRIKTLSVL